jgi:hypothetical protein
MSKEREYQVGDIVECTKLWYADRDSFTVGKHYRVARVDSTGDVNVIADTGREYFLMSDQIKLVTAVEDRPKLLTKTEALHAMIDGEKVRDLDWEVGKYAYYKGWGFYSLNAGGYEYPFAVGEFEYEIYKESEPEKITIAGKDYEVTAEALSEIMEKLK